MTSTDAALNLGDPDPEAEPAHVDCGDTTPTQHDEHAAATH